MEEKTLNESIIKIRVELQKSKIKKSGKNKFAGFNYYELSDFLPRLNELMLEENINDMFYIEEDFAYLILIKGEEKQCYKMPFTRFETPLNTKIDKVTGEFRRVKSMQDIQYLGALNTYYKRYLYINAFGITDGEIIDSMDNEEETTEENMTLEKAKEYVIKFGKHKGKKLVDIPQDYLDWLYEGDNTDIVIKNAIKLLNENKGIEELSKEEQNKKLKLITRMNELILQNGFDREKILKFYEVSSDKEMTIEQLENSIDRIIEKLKEKNMTPYDFMEEE